MARFWQLYSYHKTIPSSQLSTVEDVLAVPSTSYEILVFFDHTMYVVQLPSFFN